MKEMCRNFACIFINIDILNMIVVVNKDRLTERLKTCYGEEDRGISYTSEKWIEISERDVSVYITVH